MGARDHDEVAFMDEDDQRELDMGDIKLVTADDLNDLEWAAVVEVANHEDVAHVTVDGRDSDRILCMSFTGTAASVGKVMPYEYLFVYKDGKIASAMANQPESHRTFREMVEDTRHIVADRNRRDHDSGPR